MNELVFIKNDDVFTNTFLLSEGLNVDNRSICRLIENHFDDINSFGTRVRFQIRPFMTNGGLQDVKVCDLNEPQATFVITLMKNTKAVVAFKKRLVVEFYKQRGLLQERNAARAEFPALSEAIKLAKPDAQPHHYINEVKMIDAIVIGESIKKFREHNNIPPKESIRLYMTKDQLVILRKLQSADVGLLMVISDYHLRKAALTEYHNKLLAQASLNA